MKPFWRYTGARFAVLIVTWAIVLGIGQIFFRMDEVFGLLSLLVALMISSVVSLFLLRGLREDLARNVQERAERATQRLEESRRAEDVD